MTDVSALPRVGNGAPLLLIIGSIAIGQSLLGALTFQGVPTLMRSVGIPLDVIVLSYLAMLPWALKFLWSPLIERLRLPTTGNQRSRPILLAGQSAIVAILALLALTGPSVPTVVISLLAVAALASATMDIAGDGFAVEQAAPDRRSHVAAVQIGGSYLGMVAGSGGLLLAMPVLGWTGSLFLIAAVVAVLALPLFLIDETPRPVSPVATQPKPSLAQAFGSRGVRLGLAIVLALQTGPRLAQALAGPRMVDLGLNPTQVGFVMIAGSALALPGTVLAGRLGTRLSPVRLLRLAVALQSAALVLLATSTFAVSLDSFVAGVLLFSLCNAFGFVALYALLMGWASPAQAGVDFTMFQSADACVALLCGVGGGLLTARFGYEAGFGFAVVASLAALSVLPLLVRNTAIDGQSQ
ncbi:hypothetical protein NS226_04425 [Aureimonas ureilytica]|uniref:MFS transporter n=1 Tax=Aureimonas ureilytica TaxID=401562 RepID=A0A175RBA1_9HYPH|nr:MFS transporter [Aureimonas ureilytica]KTQ97524.1 hypothetical protein NS226_04425 [Aureimonas ureilytica]